MWRGLRCRPRRPSDSGLNGAGPMPPASRRSEIRRWNGARVKTCAGRWRFPARDPPPPSFGMIEFSLSPPSHQMERPAGRLCGPAAPERLVGVEGATIAKRSAVAEAEDSTRWHRRGPRSSSSSPSAATTAACCGSKPRARRCRTRALTRRAPGRRTRRLQTVFTSMPSSAPAASTATTSTAI